MDKKMKSVFPKELLNINIEENNEKWIKEYRYNNYDENYYQTLENIFKFIKFSDKPFNTFTISDISEYIEILIDNNYSVNRINYIINWI